MDERWVMHSGRYRASATVVATVGGREGRPETATLKMGTMGGTDLRVGDRVILEWVRERDAITTAPAEEDGA
jgi:hypothetical protein